MQPVLPRFRLPDFGIALREGHDVLDFAFTGTANQYNSLQFRTGEFAGTAFDPVLEVSYSIPRSPRGQVFSLRFWHKQMDLRAQGVRSSVYGFGINKWICGV